MSATGKRKVALMSGMAKATNENATRRPTVVDSTLEPPPQVVVTPAIKQPGHRDETGSYVVDFVKKDALLWPDQETRLNDLARAINTDLRKRGIKPERRITANTLIRAALDHLLDNEANIRGASEGEIRNSLRRG